MSGWLIGAGAAACMLGGLAYALMPLKRPAASLCLLLAPLLVYAALGRADLPDAPLAARLASDIAGTPDKEWENLSLAQAAARLAAYLRAHPEQAEGWRLLARTRAAGGDAARAQTAWARVLALPVSADMRAQAHLGFAEAQIQLQDGLVDEGAATHLQAALALDEGRDSARGAQYWLGLRAWQAGDGAEARRLWEAAHAAATDPLVRERLAQALAGLPAQAAR